MTALFHREFKKSFKRLRPGEQARVNERLAIFVQDPFDFTLNNHALHGVYAGSRSINISGDLRAVYKLISSDVAHFIALGTHSRLYL